jgi:hypothetical protein
MMARKRTTPRAWYSAIFAQGQADLRRERLVGEPGPPGQSPANGDGEAAPQLGIRWLYTALFRISR